MRNMTEGELTNVVLESYSYTSGPRLREILSSLIRHTHAFVREVKLTESEWMQGIDFITRAGRISVGDRQEVILLSDLLGISALVNMVSANVPEGATETTVIGPFFVEDAQEMNWGESIARKAVGEPLIMKGTVTDIAGEPVAGARVDLWQDDAEGFYDIQRDPGYGHDLRGRYRTNADGQFLAVTIKPTSYPVPQDGPGGELVRAAGRHPYRPAHVHAMISAEGFQTLTTHVFDEADEYIDSDVVFAVKASLTHSFGYNSSIAAAKEYNVSPPFLELKPVFRLVPTAARSGEDASLASGVAERHVA